jgi:ATP-dependent DNA helicase DinG
MSSDEPKPAAAAIADNPELQALFGPGGGVSLAIKGFESRPEQARMAAGVAQALEQNSHLIVEAGTGVGKSLGYLLPAALWAARGGKKVIVATATKPLQAQLIKKDLPVVGEVLAGLGLKLSYFLLMGSANYLCLSRLGRAGRHGPALFDEDGHEEALAKLQSWARTSESGCRAELPFAVPQKVWEEVCRDGDICLGRKCPFKTACFHRRDVALAAKADIVVVNQHLYFAGMPIPVYDALIFDEAHNAEETAAEFMGFRLTDRAIKRFLDDVYSPRSRRGLAHRLSSPPAAWLEEVRAAVTEAGRAGRDFLLEVLHAVKLDGLPPEQTAARRVQKAGLAENLLALPLMELSVLLSQAIEHAQSDMEEAEAKAMLKRCLALAETVQRFLKCDEAGCAYWVEYNTRKRRHEIALNMAPVDVSEELRKTVFGSNYPVVLTSATLAADNSFKLARSRLGLAGGLELLLDSPFNYGRQAGLLLPPGVPDPAADPAGFEKAVIDGCAAAARAVPGGTFLLFTSWAALERAYALLAPRLPGRRLFKQGDALPARLIADFKAAGDGVLLGTDTFWQGVDVPGSALSCVVLARLPFAMPDTPLEETRKEYMAARGQNYFREYTLPKAVVKFRQGFGRLIRSKTDRGAVVVLDPRVLTKQYGGQFLRSIPACARLRGYAELAAFFK